VISVLVVDDDFRVAEVHAVFVGQVAGMEVVGIAHTAAATLSMAAELQPDLVLLDNYRQNQAISLMERMSVPRLGAKQHFIRTLESQGLLDRQIEPIEDFLVRDLDVEILDFKQRHFNSLDV